MPDSGAVDQPYIDTSGRALTRVVEADSMITQPGDEITWRNSTSEAARNISGTAELVLGYPLFALLVVLRAVRRSGKRLAALAEQRPAESA